jgi:hypothetical protein
MGKRSATHQFSLPGRFMAIEQAMGMPQGRPADLAYRTVFLQRA